MRTGTELARETKRFASERRGESWFHLISTIIAFAAALTIACLQLHWSVRLVGSVLSALVLVRLFVIYHDYLHGAIFEGSRLAAIFFRPYGWLTLSPSSIWQHTHDHHHRNNARRFGMDTVGSFPILTVKEYQAAGPGVRFLYALSRHPLTILCGYVTVFFYGFCVQPLITDPRKHLDSVASILLHGSVLTVLALTRPDVLVFGALIPFAIASATGSYLFYAQHNYPGVKLRTGKDWNHVSAALHSSSYLKMSPVMHWFTANIGYHHIHHLNARIPFYRLPEAMAELEELQSPVTTTFKPKDMLACLRIHLWDQEEDRLLGFSEARKVRRIQKKTPQGSGV